MKGHTLKTQSAQGKTNVVKLECLLDNIQMQFKHFEATFWNVAVNEKVWARYGALVQALDQKQTIWILPSKSRNVTLCVYIDEITDTCYEYYLDVIYAIPHLHVLGHSQKKKKK